MTVVAHLGALVRRDDPAGARVDRARVLRGRRRSRDRRHVVDPLAMLERAQRVRVVRLPERAAVGRQRRATDRDAVPHDPGRDDDGGGRDRRDDEDGASRHEDERARDEREQDEPHVAEDREAKCRAQRNRERQRSFLEDEQRQQDDRRREELVQDLAVHVDVVPDEVWVERGGERGEEAGERRDPASPDLVDEQRGRGRDGDLRQPDDDPRALKDPIERNQEPAVERLRVGGRPPRDEAVRPVREEGAGEDVALVDVRRRDRAPLVEEDAEPRDDRRRGHECVGKAPWSGSGTPGGSTGHFRRTYGRSPHVLMAAPQASP